MRNVEQDKFHILFVIDGIEFGGGERVFVQLANGLKDRYKLSAATMAGTKFEQTLKSRGVQTFPVDMSSQLFFKSVYHILNILKKNKVDYIHSQGSRADFFSRIAGSIAGVPYIVCTIAAPVEKFDTSVFRKSIYRFFDYLTESSVNRFIVVSDSLEKLLTIKRGISTERVVKIHNGIELHRYQPDCTSGKLRINLGISQDVPLIGYIGRINRSKGIEYLIEAAKKIFMLNPGVRLLIVGEGPIKNELILKCKNLGIINNVIFTGFIDDIREILSAIDLLVFPSLSEGFPMITLESMAMAKPIIATMIDGVTEQISDGIEGILVPPKDPYALSNSIQRVIENKKLAHSLGAAARKKVEKEFSVERMIAETEKVYQSLLT
jgi:glycosyltransferase involved in cell wall biosynthesis